MNNKIKENNMKILIVSLLSLFFVSCGLLFDAEHMMVTKVKSSENIY